MNLHLSPRHLAGIAALLLLPACGAARPDGSEDPIAGEGAPPVHRAGMGSLLDPDPPKASSDEPSPGQEDQYNFTWQGGRVLSNVEVTAVYWGYHVNSTVANQIPQFYATVTDSSYMDWLSEYDTPMQTIGRGSFHGAVAINPSNTNTIVNDSDVVTEIAAQIDAGHLPAPNANTLYMIHFPLNVAVRAADGSQSCVAWCGYHSSFTYNGQSVAYAILPDVSPSSACWMGCGSAADFFDNQTSISTHELFEAITDPDYRGSWWSPTGNEIGDDCNHQHVVLPGTGYIVQRQWSKQANACVLVGPQAGVQYTTGDFDGDGKADMIITNSTGSYWYFSNGNGTWATPFSRSDLKLGTVSFTVGDFNGDGKSDVIITTSTGSVWNFSQWVNSAGTRTGGFVSTYTRSDLPLGQATFAVGDFDGNGKADMIITTSAGSSWYFSASAGSVATWNVNYTRSDLVLKGVAYTVADMDGDHRSDLIITNSTGSYWYFSNGDGTWKQPYSRSDLVMGLVSYVPGDFSGSAGNRQDLIVTTTTGSYWYWSNFINGAGTFSQPYTRSDLTLGHQRYTTGSFAGKTSPADVIITTPLGSYWYFSNGNGTWTVPYTHTDMPLGTTLFTTADFDGNGKDDMIILNSAGSSWLTSNGNGTWNSIYTRSDLTL